MSREFEILRYPVLSEKSTELKDEHNKVVLKVQISASKSQIKQAVESAFKVKVLKVNVMRQKSKVRRLGRYVGKTSSWKKAVVTLPKDARVEYFENI
ncbi:MAG: 50S ribosomal protein L23 [Candidatus Coatesbacteria bacterium]|nr:50S ribosomal protein L23 [Candidatus Coatesbacteria bacterium]